MLVEVEGFILSEVSYGEKSKIINVLTREYGIIGIMCKGAKSIKSKNRASTMRLNYVRINMYYYKNKMSTLVSADIIDPLTNIKSDIVGVSFLSYISDLTYQVFKQECDQAIYDLFMSVVIKMNLGLDRIVLMNILEIKYLEYLGVLFNLDGCALCGSKKNIVSLSGDSGGFICDNCRTNEGLVDSKVIKMIRMYYYVNVDGIKDINVDVRIRDTINMFLDNYLDRFTGLYLYSKDFLKKLW